MNAERIAADKARVEDIKAQLGHDSITDFQRINLEDSLSKAEDRLRLTLTASIPLDRLEQIAAAEGDGRCVVLPCKVGDDVFTYEWNFKAEQYQLRPGKIRTVRYDAADGSVMVSNGEYFREWLKGAFPTPEAAAAALEGAKP